MNLGILVYHLVGPGCAFPLLHTDVLVCTSTGSLSVYRTSWVPAAAATASAGPPAAGDLETEIVSYLNGHENIHRA